MPLANENTTAECDDGSLGVLNGEAADRLAAISRILTVPAGRPVMMEGAPATELYSVSHGIVSVFKLMPDGRRQITGFLYPGSFLGVTFNAATTYAYSADAVTAVTLRAYPRRDFERLLDEVPGVRRAFIAAMADELTEAQDRMLLLAHRSASERLACFLLTLARRQAGSGGGAGRHRLHSDARQRYRGLSGPDRRNREPHAGGVPPQGNRPCREGRQHRNFGPRRAGGAGRAAVAPHLTRPYRGPRTMGRVLHPPVARVTGI